MNIIDGKKLSAEIREQMTARAAAFEARVGRKAGLAVVLVGDDPASQIYVRNKIAACEQVGVRSYAYYLPADAMQAQLDELIDTLNADKNVDGILVQMPLPKHLDEQATLKRIAPDKDVDGFHAVNAGRLMQGQDCLAACTPSGIIELIRSTGTPIAGKHAVVVGRSNIVGKPVAMLLLKNDATVTICHSKTPDLASFTRQADILVAAVGRKELITGDMVKPGAVVIDVGMNRVDGKLYGDVAFESVSKIASYITPVPGGVGPMTITMLLKNTLDAAEHAER